jgi:AsmA family protein
LVLKGVAKFNLSLSELTRVFYLGGTLANPNVAVDSTQTFVTLGKAIGGVVLFGPAGVAAALLSGKIGGSSQNLCIEAIEAAQKGVELSEEPNGVFNRLGDFLKRLNPFN